MKKSQAMTLLIALTFPAISTVGCGVGSSTPTVPVFTKLAFYSDRTASPATNLFLMNMDGSGVMPVPTFTAGVYTPSVSADLTTVVYALGGFIWTSKADGSAQTELTSTGDAYVVRISPDGKKIAFNQQNPTTGSYDIWIMNVDGTGALNLTSTKPSGMVQCYVASFSADSSKIAFACNSSTNPTTFGIYTIHPDGTGLTTVTTFTQANFIDTPAFTPDATKILFALYGTSQAGINSINLDGSNQTLVVPDVYEAEILNSSLYYALFDSTLGDERIYKSNLDGSNAVALTDGSTFDGLEISTY